jgi:hypothetical protein
MKAAPEKAQMATRPDGTLTFPDKPRRQ